MNPEVPFQHRLLPRLPRPLWTSGIQYEGARPLISLLALNGLRISEATGADIEHLGLERGHRTLIIARKGGKVVTIPLAPRTARAIDLAVGERTEGPLFLAADGRRLDRHGCTKPPTLTHAGTGLLTPPTDRKGRIRVAVTHAADRL